MRNNWSDYTFDLENNYYVSNFSQHFYWYAFYILFFMIFFQSAKIVNGKV